MASYTNKERTNVFNNVCDYIRGGMSLRSSLQKVNLSNTAFYAWIDEDEDKKEQYARAASERHDKIFEEILEIADSQEYDVIKSKTESGEVVEKINYNIIQRNRLQIDSRKWMLGKMNPKKYGEKLDITSDNEKLKPSTIIVQNETTKNELDKLIDEND